MFYGLEACSLRKSVNSVINSTFRKFSIPDHKRLLMYAWKCLVVSRMSGQLRYAKTQVFELIQCCKLT